ncbi:aldehyde ferredoxin oxidoreductase C-terminal domain-containing protein [Tepidiforma sp.]|uniref:aldehyde ferredoxin oxidoreductase C-terminal domain-containing protein n=1 Tax=Tepidiforma sp. TaxID=2682230 RepID=UPI002ADD9894|nr:aldehyde ferredoxin oxidoreductase C-terminal domain-containing protein [Tepidiforma sp.]
MELDRIVRVDMTTGTISETPAPESLRLLGGRALGASLLLQETDPAIHPLHRDAVLYICPGLLGGTAATTSGRTSFVFKSPLTGGIKEANVGGQLGHRLARLGIKAIAVTGASPSGWQQLEITASGIRLLPADHLAGRSNYDLHRELVGEAAATRAAATIGPAGELRLAAASVAVTDPEGRPTRHAARGGPGAVMGAKGLKAIVVDDAGAPRSIPGLRRDEYRQHVTRFSRLVLEDPRTHNLSKTGTAGVVRFVNRDNIQSMPTRNHRLGTWEHAHSISGQYIEELGQSRGGKMLPCMAGCIIKCAILFNDEHGNHVTTALEFETIALLGSNLEIGPADAVAELDRLCDDIGLDTIEVGNAIGVAMEAGVLPWGDWQRTRDLLEEIRQGTVLGRIIGNGTVHTARTFGIDRVPAVKGQGLPAWEPRTLKGMGVTYATSPQGADHTAGMVTARSVNAETLVKQSRHEQLVMMAIDSAGLCQFTNALPADIAAFISARFDTPCDDETVLRAARAAIESEREFNRRAGFTAADDRLPRWLLEEPLHTPDGPAIFDLPQQLLDSVWS